MAAVGLPFRVDHFLENRLVRGGNVSFVSWHGGPRGSFRKYRASPGGHSTMQRQRVARCPARADVKDSAIRAQLSPWSPARREAAARCPSRPVWPKECITARQDASIAMTPIRLQITFDGLVQSEPIETEIRDRVACLEQYYPRMTGCRVLVKVPHRHQHAGRDFHVVVDVSVPGGAPIVVSHHASPLDGAPDFAAAIHKAFDAVRRQLQDFAREQRVQP
jgi:putative sigma-54 modulation protein